MSSRQQDLADLLAGYDAIDVVRFMFVGAAISVLCICLSPALQTRFLNYGARSESVTSSSKSTKQQQQNDSSVSILLDNLAAYRVPHSWFESFYKLSVALSTFWICILLCFRSSLPFSEVIDLDRPSTPFSRTQLACVLLLCQGVRRYIECKTFTSSSTSKMWIGHWLLGLAFYLGMSVAIWIEGVPAIVRHEFSIHDLEITAPSLRSAFSILLFVLASGIQHDCHAYLASLKRSGSKEKGRYQLPTFPAFVWTLTPHYFMECLIYLALAILAAPEGYWLNTAVSCACFFVIANLGVTAAGTRRWYEKKFGKEAVAGRYAMIPFIF